MSKLALINRNEKRKKLVAKFAKKRETLQSIIDDPKASDDARYEARPVRIDERDAESLRALGYLR